MIHNGEFIVFIVQLRNDTIGFAWRVLKDVTHLDVTPRGAKIVREAGLLESGRE